MSVIKRRHKLNIVKVHKDSKPEGEEQLKFGKISDLSFMSALVRATYDPESCDGRSTAFMLTKCFSNLEPVEASILMHHGQIERKSQWVLRVRGTNFIIDPLTDRFDYDNLSKLKSNLTPWIYTADDRGDHTVWFSMNHMPYVVSPDDEWGTDDWAILHKMTNPYYNNVRCIVL